VKDTYMVGRKVNLRKGNICRLWQDSISGETPLSLQFPELFDLCLEKDCTILDASISDFEIPFRRTLRGDNLLHWNAIKDSLRNLPRSDDSDFITWSLNPKKCFSTKSVYLWLERNLAGSHNKWIWKAKVPLKIKVFLWQLCQDAVLTRENMKKRQWHGSPICSFCSHEETNDHLFFTCPISKVVSGVLGKAFDSAYVPNSFWQAMAWFHSYLPGLEKFHMVILASICWAI
jgi:hypothetical protein